VRFDVLSRPRQHALRDTTRDTRFDGCAISIACLHRVGDPLHLLPERFNGHESARADEFRDHNQIHRFAQRIGLLDRNPCAATLCARRASVRLTDFTIAS
jgi:hypothetical protein